MQLYDFKEACKALKEKYDTIFSKFSGLNTELALLEEKQASPEFWSDLKLAQDINRQKKQIEKKLADLKVCENAIFDFSAMIELVEEDHSAFDEKELNVLLDNATKKLDELYVMTLLSGECDDADAVLYLHSGAGGEEAQDWTEMLSRMYFRYAEKHGFKVEVIDTTPGDGAGYKSQTFIVHGDFAYGNLKTEKGVHRLVRLSPFDANNRRHTSFASLEVSPLIEKDDKIVINEKDLKIDTFKSGGAGGQHVNKTESAVRITHIPTGTIVECQNERSQIQNREMAMKLLISKLKEKELMEKEKEKIKKFGEEKKIEWGSQIRSYVLHPYNMVKDHRTGYETSDTTAVLDGEIQDFINAELKR